MTSVCTALEGERHVFLHTRGTTFRVLIDAEAELVGLPADGALPLGPEHELRVEGVTGGHPHLPTLRATRIERLPEGSNDTDERENRIP